MTKAKKKKRSLSESKLHGTKKETKKLNAFEMHVNRRKFNVVGMKLKAERGLPGISRSRAIKKRKATLMQEYRWKDKKNTFLDRRIGEKDSAMTAEDKIMARFTAERVKLYSKKSIFNLGDGEELTHRGENLTEIEKFDDPKSDDEFDDDEDGKLDAGFVGEAHFGGGMFKKVEGESKSRKDLIDQLIAESKKKKAEKQRMREEASELTEKLDSEWKDLLPLMMGANRKDGDGAEDVTKDKKTASYDMLTKQLKFEARGKPMDKLKSEEEMAKEEKKKLEELEKQRLERMLGDTKKAEMKHRSADDLDDGFQLDEGSDFVLAYDKDGVANVPESDDDDCDGGGGIRDGNETSLANENDDDEDEECGEEDEEGDGDKEEEESGMEDVEDEEKGGDGESSSSEDDLSDLKESDMSDAETEDKAADRRDKKILETVREKVAKKQKTAEGRDGEKADASEAEKQLPFTLEIPVDYESFEVMMKDSDCLTQGVIVERMIKCNHPSLDRANKDKLDALFTYLLQHLEDSTSETTPEVNCFKVLDRMSPFLYDLAQWNPELSTAAMATVIREKYNNFLKKRKVYPGLDTLIFIKLVSLLFSTSDYRHKVATPTMIFMEEMLSSCKIASSVDVSTGLFICTLVLEFCAFSKRIVPEVFNFIRGVLRLAQPKDSTQPMVMPFRSEDADKFNLIMSDVSKACSLDKLTVADLVVDNRSDDFKARSIALALRLLSEVCGLVEDKPGSCLLFDDILPLLDSASFGNCLRKDVDAAREMVERLKEKPIPRLVLERKRPKPLKLYEPKVEEIYSLKKHKPMGKAKEERAKLQHKYKRELKGALREIRRDSSFLSKLKFREIQKSDMERHRKVREILGAVAQQTGEVRKLKRKK